MHKWIIVAVCLINMPCTLAARGLPKGEEDAWVIQKVLRSGGHEVHLVHSGKERSAFLRTAKGAVVRLNRVSGGRDCQDWFQEKELGKAPEGCGLVFLEPDELEIKLSELEESSLFEQVKGKLREE